MTPEQEAKIEALADAVASQVLTAVNAIADGGPVCFGQVAADDPKADPIVAAIDGLSKSVQMVAAAINRCADAMWRNRPKKITR